MNNNHRHPVDGESTQGKFITIEGGHGAGKTTLLAGLYERLRGHNCPVTTVMDLKATGLSLELREVFLRERQSAMLPLTEALLIAAARHESIVKVIQPALARGEIVVSERYTDAFLAFQGAGRGLPVDLLRTINDGVSSGLEPCLTILLDVDPRIALPRIASTARHRIENEPVGFHDKVRQGYLLMGRRLPDRVRLIDASLPMDVVLAEAWSYVRSCLDMSDQRRLAQ